MKIGILESRLDPFINHVRGKLEGLPVEFISFGPEPVAMHHDYRVVVDRLSFRYIYLQEMVKSLSLAGAYVINNPFTAQATNKLMESRLCQALDIPYPRTIVLPDMTQEEELGEVLVDISWEEVVQQVGLPCILKPYNGSAWEDVYLIHSVEQLKAAYEATKRRRVLLVQQAIRYQDYYRVFCINKQEVLFIKWIPRPQAMGQYLLTDLKTIEGLRECLTRLTIQLNNCLDLDLNAVEWCIDQEGLPWLIEAFNEVPDIDQRSLPPPYYEWLVDRFAGMIRQKFQSSDLNRLFFYRSPGAPCSIPLEEIPQPK